MTVLDKAKEGVKESHDLRTLPMRWGTVAQNGSIHHSNGGCFHGITETMPCAIDKNYPHIFVAFHGDGAQLSLEALRNPDTFNQEMVAHTQPFNKFVGTARTKKWIEFLIGPQSPWKALRPYLSEDSVDFINDAGFIFHDLKKVPSKLFYNFVMAIRFPWEMPKAFGLWLELLKLSSLKHQPALAFYIAMHFELAPDAEGTAGPYNILYPWSCLEETQYETLARFIQGEPITLRPDSRLTDPNVHALWPMAYQQANSEGVFKSFINNERLMRSTIEEQFRWLNSLQELAL